MTSRRHFLFLLGGVTTGVWLASTGLIRLDGRFVVALGGSCSFCGKARSETKALLGVFGRPPKICDDCIRACCEILVEEPGDWPRATRRPSLDVEDRGFEARVAEVLRQLAEERDARRAESLLADAARSFDAPPSPSRLREFQCSFCDALRRDVAKLISGPRIFICDGCIGDATAVVGVALRA